MKDIIKLLKQNRRYIIGALLGATGGFAYWYFVGCTTGTCPIKSSPFWTTLYGIFVGMFIFSLFKKENND